MTRYAAILAVLALAACGANGEPEQPASDTGVKVSGDARVGISVSQSGVRPSAAVSLGQGPVRLTVGF